MNPNTPPTSDDELPDERELAALYARLPKAEPDPALDVAVLAAATRGLPVRRRPRWPVALGSAAVLVLAVGVAWQVRETPPAITASLPAPSPRKAETPAAERDAAPAPVARVEVSALAKPKMPPQASRSVAAGDTMSGLVVRRAMRSSATVASEPPAPLAPPAPPVPSEPAIPSHALLAPGLQEARPVQSSEPVPVAAPPPPPAPAWAPQTSPVVGATNTARYLPKLDLDPDDRVGEIRRLLDSGHRDQALLRLRELRERYPHYELPQDLRDLTP